MWTDSEGNTHTVALPDPTTTMDEAFLQSIGRLSGDQRAQLAVSLEGLEDQMLEAAGDRAQPDEHRFEGASLPDSYLKGTFDSAEAISTFVAQVEPRWRFDVVETLLDLLDAL